MAVYKEMKGCTDNQAHEEIDVSDIPAEEEGPQLKPKIMKRKDLC